ncbi:uncharacterized protein BJX67DRAFT_77413 [Aspergillus lucknowensis]|uniref:Uncharacterized protein n=1 Tax=Aspergillus lucknowensis TaxID=176173 RepID=A0ABR4LTD0_9EURO
MLNIFPLKKPIEPPKLLVALTLCKGKVLRHILPSGKQHKLLLQIPLLIDLLICPPPASEVSGPIKLSKVMLRLIEELLEVVLILSRDEISPNCNNIRREGKNLATIRRRPGRIKLQVLQPDDINSILQLAHDRLVRLRGNPVVHVLRDRVPFPEDVDDAGSSSWERRYVVAFVWVACALSPAWSFAVIVELEGDVRGSLFFRRRQAISVTGILAGFEKSKPAT